MSWPVLLAEYPKPLLASKLPLIILVILERSGLITEKELGQQVKVNQQTLSSSLLDLHRNQCIVFGRHSVRISDRGKSLVDRFNLRDGILEDLLDHLSLAGQERAAYRSVITNYRDTAFPQYLNSLCTMRIWQLMSERILLASDEKMQEEVKNKSAASNQAILFTLLLRDLRNWRIHANPPNDIFENLSENFRNAIISDEPQLKIRDNASLSFRKAITLLKILRSKTDQEHWQLITKEEAPLVESLIILDDFQGKWEKDAWYEAWCDASPRTLAAKAAPITFLRALEASLPLTAPGHVLMTFRRASELGSGNWWSGENRTESITDFLQHMLVANSIEDLVEETGLSRETVTVFLATIQRKSSSLLSSGRDDASEADEDLDEPDMTR